MGMLFPQKGWDKIRFWSLETRQGKTGYPDTPSHYKKQLASAGCLPPTLQRSLSCQSFLGASRSRHKVLSFFTGSVRNSCSQFFSSSLSCTAFERFRSNTYECDSHTAARQLCNGVCRSRTAGRAHEDPAANRLCACVRGGFGSAQKRERGPAAGHAPDTCQRLGPEILRADVLDSS